jgi:crotonobetainyl-CoA:carnitine CoA-transferase CaiB-like acyl-CoA transferase
VQVDPARVAASFGSERIIRIDGEPPAVWAPLSGFWQTADGWVRTHANYPHHERALRELAGVSADADRGAFAAALARRSAVDLEERAAGVGAVVSAVRTSAEWQQHPQSRMLQNEPLVAVRRTPGAAPRTWGSGMAPLSGVRVLDLTRVLAGPVAARDLALAGAEVLRIDSPRLPETPWIHLDTGQGKRSALLDLAVSHDRAVFEGLLAEADVVVTGYRPGALARFGLDPEELAMRHPGLVTASVSAWGFSGPWAGRRGFDSIVQAATGIAMRESADGVTPGALPAQALDHSTGHFLAAAIASALVEQRRVGGSIDVRMSLARVAAALLAADGSPGDSFDVGPLPTRERVLSGSGVRRLTYAPPVLAFAGAPDDYPHVGGEWGADAPQWSSATER